VPLDPEQGYRIIDTLREVADRHGATPARVALAWLLARPAVSSVIVAARTNEHLEDNIKAVDLSLSPEDIGLLDGVSDPGVPYPKWMVLQHDTVEDPRLKVLHPELYEHGGPWRDLNREWNG
jgi:diketogulonate reductase-like aldo/keto reductase